MLFNSLAFIIFLPVVFFLYWALAKKLMLQNILLLVASYFFYACWDWRFLFLLVFSTLLDYFSGLQIEAAGSKLRKRFWFWLSICINLGFLFFFKYYNFFIDSFAQSVAKLGVQVNPWTLKIILPVGISFYTFHGLSYVIDVYHEKIKAEKNFIDYSVFVCFFPLLVAGPIERATHLLPQIKQKRQFDYGKAVDAMRQILWGFVKKIVIADQCAEYANTIFGGAATFNGSTLFIGAFFFSIQIYGDFSGYSDIALGTARLLGIDLLRNFSFPYFSRDIAEFWRRWHISLSSWFRDYLYIPLGGSRAGTGKKIRNTFIIFIVSGFWHGANWTFIAWGAIHAMLFLPLLLGRNNRAHLDMVAAGRTLPNLKELGQMILTFVLVLFAWIFFRAENITQAFHFLSGIFSVSFFSPPSYPGIKSSLAVILLVIISVCIEWKGREQPYALAQIGLRWHPVMRYAMYYSFLVAILWVCSNRQQFIYFQF